MAQTPHLNPFLLAIFTHTDVTLHFSTASHPYSPFEREKDRQRDPVYYVLIRPFIFILAGHLYCCSAQSFLRSRDNGCESWCLCFWLEISGAAGNWVSPGVRGNKAKGGERRGAALGRARLKGMVGNASMRGGGSGGEEVEINGGVKGREMEELKGYKGRER